MAEEVGESETSVGFNVALMPLREATAVRFTMPEKPFSPVTETVEAPEVPAWIEMDDGLAAKVKPVTRTVTGADREIGPLIPVPVPMTFTV